MGTATLAFPSQLRARTASRLEPLHDLDKLRLGPAVKQRSLCPREIFVEERPRIVSHNAQEACVSFRLVAAPGLEKRQVAEISVGRRLALKHDQIAAFACFSQR